MDSYISATVLPALMRGLWMSIMLIIPSSILGFTLGVALGAVRGYGPPWLRRLGDWYTALFRGIPLVLQLYFLFFALPKLGLSLEPYVAAVTAFVLCSAAYHSEYIRGALLSIRMGQIRAAQALGFSTWQLVTTIVIPQAVRRALPGCGNEIIYLIKYSSLAYIVTFMELTGEAKHLASGSYEFVKIFLCVGVFYLFLTSAASLLLGYLEKRFAIPGFGFSQQSGQLF